jgi:redox-sensitive bicupin YhaK (pirin superfamily)
VSIEEFAPNQRFLTEVEGRSTWHSFSFGSHYDPANIGFAQLVALNDEHLPPGNGYAPHPHSGIEIVTVVLEGALEHRSDAGSGVLGPGEVQRLSAGSGVVHAEMNAASGPTRFLQTWITSAAPTREPRYDSTRVGANAEWTPVAGADQALLSLDAHMDLWLSHPDPGHRLRLPDAPAMLLYVATGEIEVGERRVRAGGQLRVRDQGELELVATEPETTLALWSVR